MSSQIQGLKDAVECGNNAIQTTEVVPNATIAKEFPLLEKRSLPACIVCTISIVEQKDCRKKINKVRLRLSTSRASYFAFLSKQADHLFKEI